MLIVAVVEIVRIRRLTSKVRSYVLDPSLERYL
jgi:hypothetical protein